MIRKESEKRNGLFKFAQNIGFPVILKVKK